MIACLGRCLVLARRELAGFFHAPIAYVVGVLFLALQGFSFFGVVAALSDPRSPASYGAVLHAHFGGTLLWFAVLFAVISVISMRLVAEERRQGTWETLLTTRASEEEVLAGKWLGAVGFYLFLWAPTLAFLAVLTWFAPPGASIDPGPIAAAYLGVILVGAALLAVGLAASAATGNQIIAATATFSLCVGLLGLGQLGELAPSGVAGSPRLARAVELVDLRGHMEGFSRGAVELGAVVFLAALAAVSLAAAAWFSALGRRPRSELRRRALAVVLVALAALFACMLASGRAATLDLSRDRLNTLSSRTERILADLDEPVEVLVVRPGAEAFDPVYREVDRLLARMARAQPLLSRRDLDPALEPERAMALAIEFALAPRDLADGGAVVFRIGDRRRAVDLLEMADFGRDALGAGALTRFRAEEAFAGALLELSRGERTLVCASAGHGELPLAGEPDAGAAPHLGRLRARLERDGYEIEELARLEGGVPAVCRALLVLGPERPLSPDAALAVERYLRGGGRLLLALSSRIERTADGARLPRTGLETVVAGFGLETPAAVVVDPEREIEMPLAFTAAGYGDHPVSSPFRGRGLTVWVAPRAVRGGDPLVLPSAGAWGETDLAALAEGREVAAGAGDLLGAPPIAAAAADPETGARVVVLGSATSISSVLSERGLGGAELLAFAAAAWLTERAAAVDIGDKTPEHVRLIMTRGQLRGLFVACVILLPGLFAAVGALLWWWRRRA